MKNNLSAKYFSKKAKFYDEVDEQLYWVLSDKLLWHNFEKTLKSLPKNFTFIDAGGGTGRWTQKILKKFPLSSGVLFDISESMLEIARVKLSNYEKGGRLAITKGDFENPKNLGSMKFNIAFNFHNVIGFTSDPKKFIDNLANVTKKGGFVVTFAPNVYHGVYFNIGIGNIREAKKIATQKRGRFTKEMPIINFFTPESIKNLYKLAGLSIIAITGFPNCIYPNFQETQVRGQTTSLKKLLSSNSVFKNVFSIEKLLSKNNDISSRGNNIYILGRK
ncbi:MAG: methyltransferase domain-containing protein [bacterium]|nr:methyltransferase domain-containing protein [bacterium]